jgi:hypothetical protein
MVGLEDHAATLGRDELAEHVAADRLLIALFPELDVAVAAKTDPVPEAPAEIDCVHARLHFQRILGVDAHFHIILEDRVDIAAAMIDDVQSFGMAVLSQAMNSGIGQLNTLRMIAP